jgi:hypothetical protein
MSKSFKQFLSESVTIQGDFNGNMYIGGSQQEPQEVGESYIADVTWNGQLYRMELTSESIPSNKELTEQLQGEYPGSIVHNIYPIQEKTVNIKNTKRYHPTKLDWI